MGPGVAFTTVHRGGLLMGKGSVTEKPVMWVRRLRFILVPPIILVGLFFLLLPSGFATMLDGDLPHRAPADNARIVSCWGTRCGGDGYECVVRIPSCVPW
jgi:hypothetical protein